MSCCSTEGTNKFFSKQSKRYAKKFRKKGLDKASQRIVEGLTRLGVNAKSVLEIGCGVGGLHLTLLKQGAASAHGVDISEGMLGAAKILASEMGLAEKVRYSCGDFTELNGELSPSNVVIMDKVVCCYDDPLALIEKTSAYATSVIALSYPRNAFLAKIIFKVPDKLGELLRWSFRPHYHDTGFIERTIVSRGFREAFSSTTPIWQIKIYQKQ